MPAFRFVFDLFLEKLNILLGSIALDLGLFDFDAAHQIDLRTHFDFQFLELGFGLFQRQFQVFELDIGIGSLFLAFFLNALEIGRFIPQARGNIRSVEFHQEISLGYRSPFINHAHQLESSFAPDLGRADADAASSLENSGSADDQREIDSLRSDQILVADVGGDISGLENPISTRRNNQNQNQQE